MGACGTERKGQQLGGWRLWYSSEGMQREACTEKTRCPPSREVRGNGSPVINYRQSKNDN